MRPQLLLQRAPHGTKILPDTSGLRWAHVIAHFVAIRAVSSAIINLFFTCIVTERDLFNTSATGDLTLVVPDVNVDTLKNDGRTIQ